ncbi:N-fatty-acyl-amino acid synthase/hydrolase PM20D1-like [Acropora palmata]|uniref:N-fatty-acyl-amino acid synthase/hydrolase PM20D1-like n=1 Tax=Acropora palmata TaxID=6131 RepID=UPI003DA106BB
MAARLKYFLLSLVFSILLIIIIRTMILSKHPHASNPCLPSDLDYITADETMKRRFQKAITFQTISYQPGNYNRTELSKFLQYLLKEFSDVINHPLVEHKIIGNHSLLLNIKGNDPVLKPYLIASHLDVVPASNDFWEVPPFEGRVQDGYFWGRGTLDVKNGVMSSFEALKFLLKQDNKPQRSFYIAYGHDEEVGGRDGAGQIAAYLKSQGVKLEFIVDEGTCIFKDAIPGMKIPYAIIGVAEKGFLTAELSVHTAGGHSSMPPAETSVGIMSKAVVKLESCPMPVMFDSTSPAREMFESFAPQVPVYLRIILANLWLFGPILTRFLERKPTTNAFLRTTTAVTIFKSGVKSNVIPTSAKVTVNHRIHPENTVEEVIEHDRRCINDDRINITVLDSAEPSPMSRYDKDAFGFQVISQSVRQVFPDIGVSPGLMIANTDTMHYLELTDAVYRFMPSILTPEDAKRIHGFNERLGVKNFERMINYFYHLMRNADAASINTRQLHHEL